MGGPAPGNEELEKQRMQAQAFRNQQAQQQPQQGSAMLDPASMLALFGKGKASSEETAGGPVVQSSGVGAAANSSNVAMPDYLGGGAYPKKLEDWL